jgi:hypothetical protein
MKWPPESSRFLRPLAAQKRQAKTWLAEHENEVYTGVYTVWLLVDLNIY